MLNKTNLDPDVYVGVIADVFFGNKFTGGVGKSAFFSLFCGVAHYSNNLKSYLIGVNVSNPFDAVQGKLAFFASS
jgi:hypothetical protein